MRGFNYKKTAQALNLFALLEGGRINKMKALKLIWLSDRLSARKYGRTITSDEYYALKNGPVASATRDILETSTFLPDVAIEYSSNIIESTDKLHYKSISTVNEKVFSQTDLEILRLVYEMYGKFDQFALSDISHKFPEWAKYKSPLEKGIASRFPICQEDFFLNPQGNENLFNEDAISLEMIKAVFEENQKYSNAF